MRILEGQALAAARERRISERQCQHEGMITYKT